MSTSDVRLPIRRPRRVVRRRILAALTALLVLGLTVALAHGVTLGSFTDPATVSPGVNMAQISISLTTPGGPPEPFVGSGFYPGSVVRQDVALRNDGSASVTSVRLSTTASPANLLTTDPVQGLQLALTYCQSKWEQSGSTYTCAHPSGPTELYRGPYLVDRPLPELGSLTVQAHVLIEVGLPTTAGDAFQGLNATLRLEFRAQQIPGRVR
jgi:hypothetical protein